MHAHNINNINSHAKRQFDVEFDQFIHEKNRKKAIKIIKFKNIFFIAETISQRFFIRRLTN